MITNFEKETSPLSISELEQIPILIDIFKNIHSPIKSYVICDKFNNVNLNIRGKQLNEARLRKYTNYIRSFGLLPIIATSKGYYCSYDKKEIELQIQSLNERADAIKNSAIGLQGFLKTEDKNQLVLNFINEI
jgi:hypothetical protein